MMPSKQSEAVRKRWEAARLAVTRPAGEGPDDESWGDLTAEPRGVDYLETEAGGVPAMWAVPKRSHPDRVLLCLHGGGFVSGSVYTHRKMFGHLAKAAGARALLPGYRLLPEGGGYPVPVDEAEAAYRWLLGQGIAAEHIAFAGDSAGGWLAVTAQLRAREQGLPEPAAAVLLSPFADLEASGESLRDQQGPAVHQGVLPHAGPRLPGRVGRPPRSAGQPAVRRPERSQPALHPGRRGRGAPRRRPRSRGAGQQGRPGRAAGCLPRHVAHVPDGRRAGAGGRRRDPPSGRLGPA